jgi:hypothetical protein
MYVLELMRGFVTNKTSAYGHMACLIANEWKETLIHRESSVQERQELGVCAIIITMRVKNYTCIYIRLYNSN